MPNLSSLITSRSDEQSLFALAGSGGGGGGGVSQLVAGNGVTVSPGGGTGVVTVSAVATTTVIANLPTTTFAGSGTSGAFTTSYTLPSTGLYQFYFLMTVAAAGAAPTDYISFQLVVNGTLRNGTQWQVSVGAGQITLPYSVFVNGNSGDVITVQGSAVTHDVAANSQSCYLTKWS